MSNFNIYDLPPRLDEEEGDLPQAPPKPWLETSFDGTDSFSTHNEVVSGKKSSSKQDSTFKNESTFKIICTIIVICVLLLLMMGAIGYGAFDYFKLRKEFVTMETRLTGLEKELKETGGNQTDQQNTTSGELLDKYVQSLQNLTAELNKLKAKQVMITIGWNGTEDISCNNSVSNASTNSSVNCKSNGYLCILTNVISSDNITCVINVRLSQPEQPCIQPTTTTTPTTENVTTINVSTT